MPCDGKNPNCEKRRELLTQLKCLISSMEKKKPCEWDEPPSSPAVICSSPCASSSPYCRNALLKLTDLGDIEVALRKFYCADEAREVALAAYCRLAS
ncbi:PREDICTED: uncharacterized protein LOC108572260 [Habropoda laboriosa]|uniref:uncharacterized protein LOC108572260 n=1 Tax=Habropoda laboriosa TaxID=597456 RepID=UPI00083DF69C|nr:PREDICTED: uncharacterized protein LOC108572260 [Habropoda laboriosa]